MNRRIAALLLAAALCPAGIAPAQEFVPASSAPSAAERQRLAELKSRFEELLAEDSEEDSTAAASATAGDAARSDYDAWIDDYTREAYAWHHTSTIIIFWVVMLLVVSGVALATWQLANWLKRVRAYDEIFLERLRKGGAADAEAINGIGKAPESTLNLTKESVQLSSPYVGVAILGLSMGFFLAYLLLVYPIVQGP